MTTVALVDPFWNGHHPMYMRLFSKSLLELGCRVMAFCPAPSELSEWVEAEHPDGSAAFKVFAIAEPNPVRLPFKRLRRARTIVGRWQLAAQAIKRASSKTGHRPDLVFFPWLDSYLCGVFYLSHLCYGAVQLTFPHRWAGLYFLPTRLRLSQPVTNQLRGFDPCLLLKSSRCQAVAVLDEGVVTQLQSLIGEKPVVIFPDVIDGVPPEPESPIARQIREQANGRVVIGLIGELRKRKGVLTLLDVAERTREKNWLFVFAGRLVENTFTSEELGRIRKTLKDASGNCFIYPEFVPNEAQFNAVVDECDILFAAYEKFYHSSNILSKAAYFRKPVIVSQGYCMDERVRRFSMGVSVPPGDVAACVQAISLLADQNRFQVEVGEPDFEGYRRLHSISQLRTSFSRVLDAVG